MPGVGGTGREAVMWTNHMAICWFFSLLFFSPAADAFFVQLLPLDTVKKPTEAEELCRQNGMSLPLLPTPDDWQDFVVAVTAIADSQGHDVLTYQPWVGLLHDGSNITSPDHFNWTDGEVATYVIGSDLDLETWRDGQPLQCVRMMNDNMRLTSCNWKRHVICQGNVDHLSSSSPVMYLKRTQQDPLTSYPKQNVTYFVTLADSAQLPSPLNLRGLGVSQMDTIDCFHLCSLRTSCHVVAVLPDRTACFLQA